MRRTAVRGRGSRTSQKTIELLEARRLLSFGETDPAFGTGGKVVDSFFVNDTAGGVAIQPDGKFVVISQTGDFDVGRYNADGTPDTTFGSSGKAFLDLGGSDVPRGVAVQADGKIVVVGSTTAAPASGTADGVVVRFNQNGTLDTGFGAGGFLRIGWGGTDEAVAVAIEPGTQKIIVAGSMLIGSDADFAIARLTTTGALDTSFNGGGTSSVAFGGNDVATSLTIDTLGRYVLAGYTNFGAIGPNDMAMARFLPTGTLDTSIGLSGRVKVNFGNDDRANAVAIDGVGRIILAGSWDGGASDFAVARLLDTGTLDTTFSGDGRANATFGPGPFGGAEFGTALAVLPGNQIVVGGFTDASPDGAIINPAALNFAVAKWDPSGNFDTSFNGTGRKVIDMSTGVDRLRAMAMAPDFSLVLVGDDGVDIRMTRLRGMLDLRFNRGQPVVRNVGADDRANAVAIDSFGRIYVAGSWDGGASDFFIARYLPNGSLDTTFDNPGDSQPPGIVNYTFGLPTFGGAEFATAIALQPDGKIVVAGYTNNVNGVPSPGGNDFALLRLDTGGTLDTSFGGTGKLVLSIFGPTLDRDDRPSAVHVMADGRIVLTGTSRTNSTGRGDFFAFRLLANGTPDSSFGPTGLRVLTFDNAPFEVTDSAVDPAGNVYLIANRQDGYFAPATVLKLNASGNFAGIVPINVPGLIGPTTINAARLQPDGKLVVAGSDGSDFLVTRLNPDLSIDTTFAGGSANVVLLGGNDLATDLNIDAFGRIVVTGTTDFPGLRNRFAAIRLLPDGSLDPTFQPTGDTFTAGAFRYDVGQNGVSTASAIGPDGQLVMVGYRSSTPTSIDADFVVAKLSTPFAPAVVNGFYNFNADGVPGQKPAYRLRFESNILFSSVASSDFTLVNNTTGTTIPSGQLQNILLPSISSIELRYTGLAGSAFNVLPDGNYTLTLAANSIADTAGNTNRTAQTFNFFVLAGDANRDRSVDIADFSVVAARFNQPGTFSQGDFDYSGTTDIGDFSLLASRFNAVLPLARPLSPSGRTDSARSVSRAGGVAAAARPPAPRLFEQMALDEV